MSNKNIKMYKKLLTNLPFNPSLLGQVGFYTERLKKETFVRGAGIITLALALIIQTFAVVSPTQTSLANSPNDIIYGGFTTREQTIWYCLDQNKDIHLIFEYYRLTCDILANAETVYLKSTDYGGKLDSLGRVPQPAKNPKNGKLSEQYTVNIPGVEPLYMKNLWYWDTYASSSYKVLKMTNLDGKPIFLMYDCGNIITVDKYTPPQPVSPPPAPTPTPAPTPVDVCPKVPGVQTSKDFCDVCKEIPGEQTNQSQCYPCPEAKTNTTATACMVFDKKASNQTRGIANADKSTANPSDIIVYTLTATNKGLVEFKDFVFDENLADVLEYSDMNDYGGGALTSNKHLIWPKRSIPANSTIKVQFSVRIKADIPSTPRSSSDPGSYDLCLTNVFYDKSINICVKPPVSKQVETVAETLPKTGPGSSLVISFVIITLAGYFFARNKTMVDELNIVRKEFTSGGPV